MKKIFMTEEANKTFEELEIVAAASKSNSMGHIGCASKVDPEKLLQFKMAVEGCYNEDIREAMSAAAQIDCNLLALKVEKSK